MLLSVKRSGKDTETGQIKLNNNAKTCVVLIQSNKQILIMVTQIIIFRKNNF